jgi:non-heme chloroperoxidase
MPSSLARRSRIARYAARASALWPARVSVPVLVMNGDADQIVPYATSGPRAVKLVQNGTLKTYAGYPHGMPTTHADVINADLLTFIQS